MILELDEIDPVIELVDHAEPLYFRGVSVPLNARI